MPKTKNIPTGKPTPLNPPMSIPSSITPILNSSTNQVSTYSFE